MRILIICFGSPSCNNDKSKISKKFGERKLFKQFKDLLNFDVKNENIHLYVNERKTVYIAKGLDMNDLCNPTKILNW